MKKLLYGVLLSAFIAFSGFSVIQASSISNGELLAMNGKCGNGKCGAGKCGTSKGEGKSCSSKDGKSCDSKGCNSAEKAKKYKECKAKCEDLQCFKKCMHGDKKSCNSKGKSCDSKGCNSKKSKCGDGKCGGGKCGKA